MGEMRPSVELPNRISVPLPTPHHSPRSVTLRSIQFLALAALLAAVTGLAACSDLPEDNAVLRLRNDLGARVTLASCEDSQCHHLAGEDRNHLAPGDSVPVNVDPEGVASYYKVWTGAGSTSCMRLVVHGAPERSIVPLSSAVACESSFPEDHTSVVEAVVGWSFLLGLFAAAVWTTVVVAPLAYQRVRRSRGRAPSTVAAVLAGLGIFMGGWLFVDAYWLIRWLTAGIRPRAPVA
jgi:hypothetical protein